MRIEVQVFGRLGNQEEKTQWIEVNAGARVKDVAHELGVPLQDAGLITIDGRVRGLEDVVQAGQRVCFFPPIMGG